jgi:hypothetical protein
MPKFAYVPEADVIEPKSSHRTQNMIAFDEIVKPLAIGTEEVIKLTAEGDETARGIRLSVHRAATRAGINVKTWEAPNETVYAKLRIVDTEAEVA